jgi:hypothetical protein
MVISTDENWYYYYFYCVQSNWNTNAQRNERRVIHRSFTARAFVSLGQKRAEKIRSHIDPRRKISATTAEKLDSEVEESIAAKCIDDLPWTITSSTLIGRSKLLSLSLPFI